MDTNPCAPVMLFEISNSMKWWDGEQSKAVEILEKQFHLGPDESFGVMGASLPRALLALGGWRGCPGPSRGPPGNSRPLCPSAPAQPLWGNLGEA